MTTQLREPYLHQGIWVRGPQEEYVVKEQSLYKRLNIQKGDVVLDIGAHIGCSALNFLGRGAKEVHCFEPHPDNYDLLCRNTAGTLMVKTYQQAVVGGEQKTVDLWLSQGRFTTTHSLLYRKGRKKLEVLAANFCEIVSSIKPDVIKIDIEGGELELIDRLSALPKHVRSVGMEVHYLLKDSREKASRLRDVMAENYKAVQPIKYLDKGWNTCIAIFERKE